MTFAAARVSMGVIARRALEFGAALPVMEAFSDAGGGDSTTRLITKPTGAAENDLLVCAIGIDGGPTLTPPSDAVPWIEGTQGLTPNGFFAGGFWYKIAGAAEPADYTWTSSLSEFWAMTMWRVSGVDTSNPVPAFSTKRANGADGGNGDGTVVLPSVLTGRSNILLLHHTALDNSITLTDLAAPGGIEVLDQAHNHGGTNGLWHGAAHENFVDGGGSGDKVWTATDETSPGFAYRINHLIAVQPPIGTPSFLQLEGSTDRILFEDSSGSLKLE